MNKLNLQTKYKEYLPLIQPKRIDFVYNFFIATIVFLIFDILSFYFPGWRYRNNPSYFPSFFTYFGLFVGIILLFRKKKAKIIIDFNNKTLTYNFLTIFQPINQREISLNGTYTDLSQHKSGRRSKVWILKIFKNRKCIFSEKESPAHYSKDKLDIIYNDLKKLNE